MAKKEINLQLTAMVSKAFQNSSLWSLVVKAKSFIHGRFTIVLTKECRLGSTNWPRIMDSNLYLVTIMNTTNLPCLRLAQPKMN